MRRFNVTVNGVTYDVVVEEVGGAPAQAPVAAPVDNSGVPGEKKSKKFFVPMIIFIILLLAAIVLLIFSLLKERGDRPDPEPELLEAPESTEIPMVIPPAIQGPLPIPEPEPEPVIVPVVAPEPEPEPVPVVVPPALKPKPKAPPKKKEGFVGKMAYINIDTLAEHFEDGAKITLAILKEKGLMEPETKQMKILARNAAQVNKKFIIETQGISAEARKFIVAAGGKVIITKG